MAGNPSMRRALLPAFWLAVPPLLLLLLLQLTRPALLATPWPWLLAFALVGWGTRLFGRYLYRRAELVGEQLLAANRGEIGTDPFDGDPHGPVQQALSSILDQRRRSEQALRASEQRFQLALEASDAYLWEYCLKSGRFSFDTSIARMFLDDETATIETDMPLDRYLTLVHPDDLSRLRHSSAEFYRSGEFTCEYRCRHNSRGYIWLRCRGRVMARDDDGTPLRALGIICDISDLKQAEEKLQQALIVAEDANHTRAQFLAGISHELRTPLNGVLGYAQLLLRDAAIDGERRGYLEALERCGQHLLQLINDIIDLAQIDSGRFELDERDCDLHALLDNVAHVARQQAEAKQLQFDVELASRLPTLVHLDELKLRQILHNLLNNAVKFTTTGGVTLRVGHSSDAGPRLLFEVHDTGVGIAEAQLAEIFEPFSALAVASHAAGSGVGDTGLGLAVSQRLCQLMGGCIDVSSTLGRGSCFRFTLPCHCLDPSLSSALNGATRTASTGSLANPAQPVPAALRAPLHTLPAETLQPLQAALALGDPEGLREALARLQAELPECLPLIERCNMLLDGFDLEQIRILLADSLENV